MLAENGANMSLGLRRAAPFLLLLTACINRTTVSRAERRGVADERSTRVTAAELSRYADGQSLMEALQRLRPGFLVGRSRQPMVSVDGTAAGDQSILNSIPASDVFEVRLVKAGSSENMSAIRPNGDVIVGDLLLVLTRKR